MYNKNRYNKCVYNKPNMLSRLVADLVGVFDVVGVSVNYIRTVVESISIAQAVSSSVAFFRTIYDNMNVVDRMTKRVLNSLSRVPTIISATTKRMFVGSALSVKPERN